MRSVKKFISIILCLAALVCMFPAAASAEDGTEDPFPDTVYAQEAEPDEDNISAAPDIPLGGNPADKVIKMMTSFLLEHPLFIIPLVPATVISVIVSMIENFIGMIVEFFENPGDYIPFPVFE